MKAARATANAPSEGRTLSCRSADDGVVRAAGVPVGLVTTFDRPDIVEPLRDDSEGNDSVVYADHDRDIVDLIEEERCPRSPDGTHTYIGRSHCNYCDMQAPWLRRDMCRQL